MLFVCSFSIFAQNNHERKQLFDYDRKFFLDDASEAKANDFNDASWGWKPDGGISYIGLKALSSGFIEKNGNNSFWSEMGDKIDYYFVAGKNKTYSRPKSFIGPWAKFIILYY
jgi:hypothetical protein